MITVVPLKPLEPPYPRGYDPNAKCDYHARAVGHSTKKCWSLKHKVQDLVEGGWLGFKENQPNVNSNPLAHHGGQSINALSHESSRPEFEEPRNNRSHTAQVATIGQIGGPFPKPLIIHYDPIPTPQAPFIIEVHAKPAYQDNRAVLWRYDPVIEVAPTNPINDNSTKDVVNITKVGGVTRSGRIYTLNALRKKGLSTEAREATTKAVKAPIAGKEAEEFLKIIRHNEYQLLDQMNKTPARISLLSLLLNLESHWNLLLKMLNEAHVAQDITVERFDGMVNNITSRGHLTFFEEEVPTEGRGHNQPLHISVKCGDYMIARVLIDNGLSLNVLPKAILDKLASISSQLKANSVMVQAFDGSKREVMEITLPICIGPTVFDVTFQVMDIHPAYSCLPGRPWINAAGAVPSSLHQRVKFVDGH
ncbi:hypothetical protein CR513_57695, partial [Mucuna pruriens]